MACLRAALLAASAGALVIPTQPVLTRYAAGKVLEAAELKAKDEDWPVTICVCDGGGVPLCLARLDGAFPASVTLATEKARTAAQFRKPTLDLESAANDKRPALSASGFTVLGGGEPIFVDGYCVGAGGEIWNAISNPIGACGGAIEKTNASCPSEVIFWLMIMNKT